MDFLNFTFYLLKKSNFRTAMKIRDNLGAVLGKTDCFEFAYLSRMNSVEFSETLYSFPEAHLWENIFEGCSLKRKRMRVQSVLLILEEIVLIARKIEITFAYL